jgi:hypothetical protein
MGYEVDVEEFSARRDSRPWFAAYFSLALAGALLIVPLPLAGALLGAAALVLYARDAEGRPIIRPRGGVSMNVVAHSLASSEPRAVVIAHLDSGRSSLRFHPRVAAFARSSTVALNIALVAIPFVASVAWIAEVDRELPAGLWFLSGVLAAYVALMMALEIHSIARMPLVAGANDNASGVEVLMRVAAYRPEGVWFVVTGSAESGMLGIQAFLQRHDSQVGDASFINVDTVGSGRLIATSEEGTFWPRDADGALVMAAEAAGAEAEPWLVIPTDATVLLARNFRAVSLLRTDDRGVLPNAHRPTDVITNLDADAIEETATAVSAMLARVHRMEHVK